MQRSDFEQWGQLIIAVVVVLGSLFGAVSKKLIKMFSPKPPETSEMSELPTITVVDARDTSVRVEPARPVALPTTSTPTGRSAPTGRSLPTRRSMPTARPATPSERLATPVKPMPPEAPVRRSPHRVEPGLPSAQPVARRARPTTTRAMPPSKALKGVGLALDASVEEHLGHLRSEIEDQGERVSSSVEQRIGHLETHIDAAETVTQEPRRHPVLGLTNQASLRHAVLMREILGPPIALRDSNDAS